MKVYAGTLESPPGQFHLEHDARRGWAGAFCLTDSDEVVQLMLDRYEPGHTMGNSHASWESASGNSEDEYYDGHQTDCGSKDPAGNRRTAARSAPRPSRVMKPSAPGSTSAVIPSTS